MTNILKNILIILIVILILHLIGYNDEWYEFHHLYWLLNFNDMNIYILIAILLTTIITIYLFIFLVKLVAKIMPKLVFLKKLLKKNKDKDKNKDIYNFQVITKDLLDIITSFIPLLVYLDYVSKIEYKVTYFILTLLLFITIPTFFISSMILEKYRNKDDTKKTSIESIIIAIISVMLIYLSVNMAVDIFIKNTDKINDNRQDMNLMQEIRYNTKTLLDRERGKQ